MSQYFIDPDTLPEGHNGDVQVMFLGLVYGFILFTASGWIAEGSELLLLIPSIAGFVGTVVLPFLGAVPDGAIVLFSGIGPDAQEELSVGVGALAGMWDPIYAGSISECLGTKMFHTCKVTPKITITQIVYHS